MSLSLLNIISFGHNNTNTHAQKIFLSSPSAGCVPPSLGMCNRIGSSGMVAGGGHTLVQKFSGALSDVKSISPARGLVVCIAESLA